MAKPLPVWDLRAGQPEKLRILRRQPAEPEDDEEIRCMLCGHGISTIRARIEVQGGHEHFFENPAGFRFRVGCFRSASGVDSIGGYTEEFTWFPGFSWCYCLCGNCRAHLGWQYAGGEERFFGLILDRLVQPD
jgi:hypothetical protein